MNIQYFDSLSSTNTYLKEHATLPHQTVVSADQQTMGKGRLGRVWRTPTGNLSASVLFHQPNGDFSLYPLVCALAVAHFLKQHTDQEVAIKWPNDLVINGKKVCGILCESVIASKVSVICGIGVNLNMTAQELQQSDLPYGTSLSMITGKQYDNRQMAVALMSIVIDYIERFEREGFVPFHAAYQQQLVSLGKTVQVIAQGRTVIATCLGIAPNGNLQCQNEDGIFLVHSGEASVRGLYGYI